MPGTNMLLHGVHHIALICTDYQRSHRFYTKILGLKILAENFREQTNSWKLDLEVPGGGRLELFWFAGAPVRQSYPEAAGLRHLAFAVKELEPAIRYLEEHGVGVEPIRVDSYTGQRFTFFADPDNLPLELYEERNSDAP